MGKVDGFLQWQRQMPKRRPARLRVLDYKEVYLERSNEQSKEQGGRCMDCGIPFCQQGCPLGNQIPDWNDLVYRGRWKEAWHALESTNDFPEFTGRLCPAPCEGACVLSINEDPVTIEQIEKEIVERAFAEGWVLPKVPARSTGKRVAVVGSGPAGLAAARQLRRAGHEVRVFERDERIGGLLRYGIPDFKLEKWVIDRRIALLEAEGITFETRVEVGQDPTWTALRDEYDAVVIATGAMAARDLDVPGRDLQGVHLAMTYLARQNRVLTADTPLDPQLNASGKRVVILGGGDTGSDCLGTALRQGASHVTQIELMPSPPDERGPTNPWPQWPFIMRTSSSQEEGGARQFAMMTTSLSGTDGRLEKLHGVKVDLHREGGKTRLRQLEGTEFSIEVDMLILALGFLGPVTESLVDQLGIELDARGNVASPADGFRTSVPGVYVAGDSKRGASLIVWAISDGREAARAVDADLTGRAPRLPTRGIHQPFGGR